MRRTLLFLMLLLAAATAHAQAPRTISYQGVLADQNGVFLPDGNHTLMISLYPSPTGSTALWTESQQVVSVKGLFNAILGSVTPIGPSITFDRAYYLAVRVDGGSELTPRTPLTAAPYAFRAEIADGLSPTASGAVLSINGKSGTILLQGAGGTSITESGGVLTINSPTGGSGGDGISDIQNLDGTIAVIPNGPARIIGIVDNAITNAKIADGTIASADIADNGVASADIFDGTIALADIGADAVDGARIVDGSVGTADIASDAINGVKILDGTIGTADVADNAINAAKILDGAVGTSELAAGSVTGAKIGTTGATSGQILTFNGNTALWANPPAAGGFSLPYAGSASSTTAAFRIDQSGTGAAGHFVGSNAACSTATFQAESNSWGGAAYITGSGTGSPAMTVKGSSTSAMYVRADGASGYAGQFRINNSSNGSDAVIASTDGYGNALVANQGGTAGNIAVFQSNGSSKARIDKAGKGYFNGGTQSSGADVAETFAVEGSIKSYEPGDVLMISTRNDRTVELSDEPYSTRVIGVYATKPGVLLTERDSDSPIEDLVPMGVVGVIPTKVSTENGAIRRGDLLVSAGTPGHAMKADPLEIEAGTVIGKALQDFDGETGIINVFVNVR